MWLQVLVRIPFTTPQGRGEAGRLDPGVPGCLAIPSFTSTQSPLQYLTGRVGLYPARNTQFTKKGEKCSVKDSRKRNNMGELFKK